MFQGQHSSSLPHANVGDICCVFSAQEISPRPYTLFLQSRCAYAYDDCSRPKKADVGYVSRSLTNQTLVTISFRRAPPAALPLQHPLPYIDFHLWREPNSARDISKLVDVKATFNPVPDTRDVVELYLPWALRSPPLGIRSE